MSTYREFLQAKAQRADGHGFEPGDLPVHLFEFQRELVEWATRQGRAAIFADCVTRGRRKTGKPVLLLTPLAVGFQIVGEAEKFGHDAALSRDGKPADAAITVSNYEQAVRNLDAVDADQYVDEPLFLDGLDGGEA